MAIAFRSASPTPNTTAADPLGAPALPTGAASGDMILLLIWYKYDTTTIASTPTNWTKPSNSETTGGAGAANTDSGVGRIALYTREYDGVWSMPTLDLSGVPNAPCAHAAAYSKSAGETWDAVVCGTASDTTGSTTIFDPPASSTTIELATGDVLGEWIGINGDAGTPTVPGSLTVAGVTLGTLTNRINFDITTGQDAAVELSDAPYSSGTASAGPNCSVDYTGAVNANMAGAVTFFRLRVTAAPVSLPNFLRPDRALVMRGRR